MTNEEIAAFLSAFAWSTADAWANGRDVSSGGRLDGSGTIGAVLGPIPRARIGSLESRTLKRASKPGAVSVYRIC